MNEIGSDILTQVTVVIRSVGERTEPVCRKLILDQHVPESSLFVIREFPFSQAMRTSFRIGMEQGRPWTLCADADLLLRPGSIAHMLELGNHQPSNVCELQGLVLDKFFGGPRPGGVHLYRTAHIEAVLARIPPEGRDIRPEHHALKAMTADGFPFVEVSYIVGLHDFEQSYHDIFRNSFVYAHKHQHLTAMFTEIWRDGADYDADYRVALSGFARGILHYGEVRIDARDGHVQEGFRLLSLEEKPSMAMDQWTPPRIEAIIDGWHEPVAYRRWAPSRFGLNSSPSLKVKLIRGSEALRERIICNGLIGTFVFAVGWVLIKAGQRIQMLSRLVVVATKK